MSEANTEIQDLKKEYQDVLLLYKKGCTNLKSATEHNVKLEGHLKEVQVEKVKLEARLVAENHHTLTPRPALNIVEDLLRINIYILAA